MDSVCDASLARRPSGDTSGAFADDIHLLMRPRTGASAADSEAVRTITERLDRMLSTNRIVRDTLLELRTAAHTLAQDLEDEST